MEDELDPIEILKKLITWTEDDDDLEPKFRDEADKVLRNAKKHLEESFITSASATVPKASTPAPK